MRIAYIAHPISGNIKANLADLRRIVRAINLAHEDVVPFCPYYADVVSLDDTVPAERERGIKNDHELFERKFIDELWLCGDKISRGMEAEIELAVTHNIPVFNFIGKI